MNNKMDESTMRRRNHTIHSHAFTTLLIFVENEDTAEDVHTDKMALDLLVHKDQNALVTNDKKWKVSSSTEECKLNRSIKPYALDINSKEKCNTNTGTSRPAVMGVDT